MDPTTLIPPPPVTSDLATWLSIVLVLALLIFGIWVVRVAFPLVLTKLDDLNRAAAAERKELLTAFKEELQAERASRVTAQELDRSLRAGLGEKILEVLDDITRGAGCKASG